MKIVCACMCVGEGGGGGDKSWENEYTRNINTRFTLQTDDSITDWGLYLLSWHYRC